MHRVSYYAIPRSGPDKTVQPPLKVQDIDPFLSTHIIVAFAKIENNELKPMQVPDVKIYHEVLSLKTQNPDLKVLLSIGGSSTFSALVRDQQAVIEFCKQSQEFLDHFGFDGLDVDWEFPGWPLLTGDCREKQWFTKFVKQLSMQLKSSTRPLLLTAAVGAPKAIIDRSYEVDQLAKYFDFVLLMGYDYHIFWPYLPFTGHNAPLTRRTSEKFYFATMNIEWSVGYWVQKGMPKEKLVVGIPTYGRTWKLLNQAWHNIASPSIGEGVLGGTVSYPQAYSFIQEGAQAGFDPQSRVPYAWRERDWMSYEDCDSIKEKAIWIRDSGCAGVMTWNLNCDDWAGVCSGKKFELHNIIKDVIGSSEAVLEHAA